MGSENTPSNNYRPITCLPIMWIIVTAQIKEQIYYSLISRGISPDEQKGCCKRSRDRGKLLYIDQHIPNESKKNLAIDTIDNKRSLRYGPPKLDTTRSQNV